MIAALDRLWPDLLRIATTDSVVMPSSVFTGVTATLSARPKVTIALILMRSLGSMDAKNFDLCRVIRDNCAGIVGEPAILFERNKQLIFAPYYKSAIL